MAPRSLSRIALVATLLVKGALAAPQYVQERDLVVSQVMDMVLVTEQVYVTQEPDGSLETGAAIAVGTATVPVAQQAIQQTQPAATTPSPDTTSPVAPSPTSAPETAPASATSSDPADGAAFFEESATSAVPVGDPTTESVADPTTVPAAVSSSEAPLGSKKGVAYNDVSLVTPFDGATSWAYNWASSTATLPQGITFFPMLWGLASDFTGSWMANAKAAIAQGSTHLLYINEPDLASQSNTAPDVAAQGWMTYMEPFHGQAKLCSPAVTNGGAPDGLTWLQSFMGHCSGCHIDVATIHWYGTTDQLEDFQSHVNQTYTEFGLPIYITEFQASGSQDDQETFMKAAMSFLDDFVGVEGYAWFMASDGNLITGTSLSQLGEAFIS